MASCVLEPYTLNPTEQKKWGETRAALLFHCPAFASIFYTMLDTVGSDNIALFTKSPEVPIAATDGSSLILNPDGFFKLELAQRVFVVSHEIMHCIFDHCGSSARFKRQGKVSYQDGKKLDFDYQEMNIAQDLVINDALIESKVGKFVEGGMHDKSIATHMDSAIDVYRKIHKKKPPPGKGFDVHLAPGTSQGKDPASAQQARSPQAWANAVAAGAAAAKAMGKLPAAIERLLSDALEPQVDWREKIQALFARRVGSDRYDWRKADRRLITRDIFAPGRSSYGAGTIVVAADTSGSIGAKELDMFFGEMAGILEDTRAKELVIIWCDAAINRVDFAEEAGDLNTIRCKGACGGGGTSFVPVFDEIVKMGLEPDALVYLTDGYGVFPAHSPSFPVIWGNISPPGAVKYPFGDVVDVPKQDTPA
jgi:predicted metal-dependent peptidase